MPKLLVVALNGFVEGQEAEYNRWYDQEHIPALLRTPGMMRARRFKIINTIKLPEGVSWPYLAVYEIETDDAAAFFKAMGANAGEFSPAMDRSRSASIIAIEMSAQEKDPSS